MSELPFAHGGPPLTARFRSTPEDFIVDEQQAIVPDGEGEHAWLLVRKRGANTEWVSKRLADFAGVRPVDVGYAGLKDRDAVTTQVMTVHLGRKPEPDWRQFPVDGVDIIQAARHGRKLKRGALTGNAFTITLRDVQGDREAADACLSAVAAAGVPNYFGEQRFGRGGANVDRAQAMFGGRRVDRDTRSLLLSAARSHLFNAVLAERVTLGNWQQGLSGEIWSLNGSRSWFGPEDPSDILSERLAIGDIHPSCPLWGRGALPTADEALALEERVLAPMEALKAGLEGAGMEQDRRPSRLMPKQLRWDWLADDVLQLRFSLPPGCYATVVMRELAAAE